MNSTGLLLPKSISPYAQALKHVALRSGKLALGSSAKESELLLYRKGMLPVDYRPLVQGNWDDTVERWTHAWQFPADEGLNAEGERADLAMMVSRNQDCIQELLDFGTVLLEKPPFLVKKISHELPMSSIKSSYSDSDTLMESPESGFEASVASLPFDLLSSVPVLDLKRNSLNIFSEYSGVPLAYLDDKSEQSNASKNLCRILEKAGLDYTEDGLITVISAMANTGFRHLNVSSVGSTSSSVYFRTARAIFDFASIVGLGPSTELYKALMRHASCTGDTKLSMDLIEEMKEKGITPTIGNWHELMRSFHKAKDYGAVSKIAENMKMYASIEPNEVTFALQLRALAKDHVVDFNALAEAVQLFDQMEQVYGFIPSRPHYDALMFALSQSPSPEMRLQCQDLSRKMELLGITWNSSTFLHLIRSAQVVGDVEAVEHYLGTMRERGIPVTMIHLAWAVQAHAQRVIRQFQDQKEENEANFQFFTQEWKKTVEKCLGIHQIVRDRGWEMQLPFLNALLRLCCQCAILITEQRLRLTEKSLEETRDNFFEETAQKIWSQEFSNCNMCKDSYSYECYIAFLAHHQRVDEAEALFQRIILKDPDSDSSVELPTRRTYESLLLMHLSSGEEGGAARALHYLEAMERSGFPVRPSLLKKMVRVHNAAGYRRDMKRRARRIMQAREEYMARKAENERDTFFHLRTQGLNPDKPNDNASGCGSENAAVLILADKTVVPHVTPTSLASESTFSWWQQWKRDSINKHELFEDENEDGTPKGNSFEEKNRALFKMGIESLYKQKSDIPHSSFSDASSIVAKLRANEGEVSGSIWSMDGGNLAYPKDAGGPEGWGVKLWRERQLVQKQFVKVHEGIAPAASFSTLGNTTRPSSDQMDIESSNAKTHGELSDWRLYDTHRYDDDSTKPSKEMVASSLPSLYSSELVWQNEARDSLSSYKSDEELAISSDNTFYEALQSEARVKTSEVVKVLQERQESDTEIKGRGSTRRSKYDYLDKWREMYRHGTLDAKDLAQKGSTPLLRFGRRPDDHTDTLSGSVREWFSRNKKGSSSRMQIKAELENHHRWSNEDARIQEQKIGEIGEHVDRFRKKSAKEKVKKWRRG